MPTVRSDWQTIDQNLRALAKRRSALDAEEASWLRQAEAARIWREVGEPSMLSYLERACGYSPRTAQERMRVARALGTLPQIEHALSVGELTYSAVRELTRAATAATEDEWLIAAIDKNLRQVEELVAGHGPGSLPDDPPDPKLIKHSMRFEMSPETFAMMRQCRRLLAEDMGATPDDDTFLGSLARHFLNGSSEAKGPRDQMASTLCTQCKRGWQNGAGIEVELDAPAIELAKCDAKHIGSLDGTSPERAHTDITEAVRRFVWARDQGRCRVPGCRSSRAIDIHHILPRERGGGHDASNLILCCWGHHTAAHKGLLTITGTADELVVNRPQVVPILPPTPVAPDVRDVVKQALMKMGFRAKEAERLVETASAHVGATSLKILMHEALRISSS